MRQSDSELKFGKMMTKSKNNLNIDSTHDLKTGQINIESVDIDENFKNSLNYGAEQHFLTSQDNS